MTQSFLNNNMRTGTIGGTLCCLFANTINGGDIFRTGLLAAIGAFVSCLVSLLFRMALRRWRRETGPDSAQ